MQRVKSASVTIDETQISSIGAGCFCWWVSMVSSLNHIGLGCTNLAEPHTPVAESDTAADAAFVARKVLGTRFWEDENGRPWKKHVKMAGLQILSVSQFTLYGTVNKKNHVRHAPRVREQSEPGPDSSNPFSHHSWTFTMR